MLLVFLMKMLFFNKNILRRITINSFKNIISNFLTLKDDFLDL